MAIRTIKYIFYFLAIAYGGHTFSLVEATAQLPIVVVMCSYNNASWVVKNLDSVFKQNYSNFRVIYIDDASDDNTAAMVKDYIQHYSLQDKITLIENEERCRKVHNMYMAFHMCKDNEIIVQLDADDWFAHNEVLATVNKEYLTKDIWVTYGTHRNFPVSDVGSKSALVHINVIHKRLFRNKNSFYYMPTRTFYAWLAKLIKLEDLITDDVKGYEGKFYPTSDDCMLMWALLEMAHYHFEFIKDISYIANRSNPNLSITIERNLMVECAESLAKQVPLLKAVREPIIGRMDAFEQACADVIIFSSHAEKTDTFLQAIFDTLQNIQTILVVYQPDTSSMDNYMKYSQKYQALEAKYPHVQFAALQGKEKTPFYIFLQNLKSTHVLLCTDTMIMHNTPIDCRECIQQLERTFAYGFYIGIHEKDLQDKQIPYQALEKNIYAWKFLCDTQLQIYPNTLQGGLYRKYDAMQFLLAKDYVSLYEIIQMCKTYSVEMKKVGLFYK